jgi:ubiquinone/menaquinone biosynthesis C-methylase UbiE
VQSHDNQDEFTRLQIQDHMITTSMGGALPEQPDQTSFKNVLDIGCGTGGWLIEAAKTHPEMTQMFGIDTSGKMLDYARAQAEANQVSDRAEFQLMDALHMLEFPTNYFDLVNMRFAQGWIRKWDWPKLLQEALRVTQPGGVVRFTEADTDSTSSSPAFKRLNRLLIQALYQAGHYFTPGGDGITAHLIGLMHQHGVLNIQTRTCTVEYRAGTPEGQFYAEDVKLTYQIIQPFLRKWTRVPDDYETTYQQMLVELQAPDFVARGHLLTAWGNK